MKYARVFMLLAVGMILLTVFSSSASATRLTRDTAGNILGVGTVLHLESENHITFHTVITVTCNVSTIQGEVNRAGGPLESETVEGPITSLTFTECGPNTITVVAGGSFSIHTDTAGTANGNGILTATGSKITMLTHNILGTVHCIYTTSGTKIGTITGSRNQPEDGTATLSAESAVLPQESTDFGCGNEGTWTGNYKITTPDYLDVD